MDSNECLKKILAIEGEIAEQTHEMEIFITEHEGKDGKFSTAAQKTYARMQEKLAGLQSKKQGIFDEAEYAWARHEHPYLFPDPNGASFAAAVSPIRPGISGKDYHRNFINAFRQSLKPQALTGLNAGSQSDGGYLLPTEFDNQLAIKLQEENVMRQISKTITTQSTHQIPIVASEPGAQWLAEGEEITLSKPQFAQKSLSAYKLAIGSRITNELLQDSFYNLEAALLEIFSRSIAVAEEEAFINGDGEGKPLGLLKALSSTASGFIPTRGSEISADDAIALYYTVARPYRQNAVWQQVIQLLKIFVVSRTQPARSCGQIHWSKGSLRRSSAKRFIHVQHCRQCPAAKFRCYSETFAITSS